MARRPSTTGPRRIGMPNTTTGPMIIPGTEELPFKKIPPRKQFLQRPPSIEQRRPPTIEERVAQVLSGPSFPGRQMPKIPEQPMRMPEPVGPVTDMRTMPSMPTTGIASLSDVLPLLDMGGEDIMQLLSDLPKTPPAPIQPPAMPIVEEILKDLILKEGPMIIPGTEELPFKKIPPIKQFIEEERPPMMETPPFAVDPIPDPITGDRYPVQPMMPLEILPAPETAPSPEPMMPPEDFSLPIPSVPEPMMPPAPETETALEPMMPPAPETETTPEPMMPPAPETETTPVQGMTMEQMQQMIADMQAQQQEQAAAKAIQEKEMAQNYMVPTSRMGYNPYLSGQYQSDPYGPSGVPNMGGITTIPVPDGYGIYNPVYGR